MGSETHAFCDDVRISRDAFIESGVKQTLHDKTLRRFVHFHSHGHWYNRGACNHKCCVIEQGEVTPLADAPTEDASVE
jgi:hypothetical protein